MISKKDFLLQQMIRQYIKAQEPIGSESLRILLDVKMSSATIRNYFKILGQEGIISQPHISSGRIPTMKALRNYWREMLNPALLHPKLDSSSLARICGEFKIACIIRPTFSQKLLKTIEIDANTIALVFECGIVAIRVNASMTRFCRELVGLEIDDIKKIAKDVCAQYLSNALETLEGLPKIQYFGLEFLSDLLASSPEVALEILKGDMLSRLDCALYFPEQSNYIIIGHKATFKDQEAKMLCIGKLEQDYEAFYEHIA